MDIEEIQKLCLSLPSATEDIKWEHDLVFSVGGKMFCMVALTPPFKYSFKVSDGEFEELILKNGFVPAIRIVISKNLNSFTRTTATKPALSIQN